MPGTSVEGVSPASKCSVTARRRSDSLLGAAPQGCFRTARKSRLALPKQGLAFREAAEGHNPLFARAFKRQVR